MKTNKNISVIKMGGTLLDLTKLPILAKNLSPYIRKNPSLIVHGGGKEVTALCEQLHIPTKFIRGRRFTDPKTMEIVEMVLAGKINPFVTHQLRKTGLHTIGLSGRSADLVQAKRIKNLGQVGLPSKINSSFLFKLFQMKFIPILSSIADDGHGNALNVNADEMASAIATSIQAKRLILFTDVPGILDAQKKTIPIITPAQSKTLIQKQIITGGMIPKIQSACKALQKGVKEVWILQGQFPIHKAQGTVITQNPKNIQHPFQNYP